MACRTPFVILFIGRSGSSHLQSLLGSHPDVNCFDEVFNEKSREGRFQGVEAVEAHLTEMYSRPETAAGFQFKYPKQPALFPEVTRWLGARRSEVRVIQLRRNNRLKGAISLQNWKKIRAATAAANLRADSTYELQPLKLDIDAAIARMRDHERADIECASMAEQFEHSHLLTYEELCSDPASVVSDLLSFLGVDKRPLVSDLRKATTDDMRTALANYDEVAERLAGTKYAKYLDSP